MTLQNITTHKHLRWTDNEGEKYRYRIIGLLKKSVFNPKLAMYPVGHKHLRGCGEKQ